MVRFGERPVFPEHQADAVLSQGNPVSGTKYTVLDTTKNVRIINIVISCTWTVQPTPLECYITIDGVTLAFPTNEIANPASGTAYRVVLNDTDTDALWYHTTASISQSRAFLIESRSVKVEVEITGGTVSNLFARVKYAKF